MKSVLRVIVHRIQTRMHLEMLWVPRCQRDSNGGIQTLPHFYRWFDSRELIVFSVDSIFLNGKTRVPHALGCGRHYPCSCHAVRSQLPDVFPIVSGITKGSRWTHNHDDSLNLIHNHDDSLNHADPSTCTLLWIKLSVSCERPPLMRIGVVIMVNGATIGIQAQANVNLTCRARATPVSGAPLSQVLWCFLRC